jgi:Zn-dependent protease with chaperone function
VWSRGVALPLYLLFELATRLLRSTKSRPLQFTIRILLWPVLVTVHYGVIPIQAAVWRRAEYRADAIAAQAGYGPGLRTALTYVRRSFDGSRSGWDAAICATHPPNELRLEALEQAGHTYPLHEDHPLLRSVPGFDGAATVAKGW